MTFGEFNFTADCLTSTDGTVRFLATTSLCLCQKTLEHFAKLQQVQHAQCCHLEPPQFLRSDPAPSKTDFLYFYMHSGRCRLWRNFLVYVAARYHNAFHPRATVYAKKQFAVISNFEIVKIFGTRLFQKGFEFDTPRAVLAPKGRTQHVLPVDTCV